MFDPKDSNTIGYHLFFLPSGKLFDDLQNIIDVLAEKYNGARFEPHLTLLARIPKADEKELIAETKKLAGTMKPFEIELKTVHVEDAYFRALYCKAEYSSELKASHQKALDIFGFQDVNLYFPHLSLYYGNISNVLKEEMIASLSLPTPLNFVADKIYLYRTEGEAKDWVRIGEYVLGG